MGLQGPLGPEGPAGPEGPRAPEADLEGFLSNIEYLLGEVTGMRKDFADLEETLYGTTDAAGYAVNVVETLQTELKGLNVGLSSLEGGLWELEKRLYGSSSVGGWPVEGDIETLYSNDSLLEDRLQALESRIATAESNINSLFSNDRLFEDALRNLQQYSHSHY